MNLLKQNKIARLIFAFFAWLALAFQTFPAFFAVLFFAVSPLDALTGAKAEKITIQGAYICPMGIEWKPGTETVLERYGFNHAGHSASQSAANDMKHTDHQHHTMHDMHKMHKADPVSAAHAPQSSDQKTPYAECPVGVMSSVAFLTLAALAFIGVCAVYLFGLIILPPPYEKRLSLSSFLYRLFPPKNAPPLMI